MFCDGDSEASQGCVIDASELNVSLEAGTYYVAAGGWNGAVGNVSLDVLITTGTDCNGNGVSDEEDIANGTSEDCNSTIPDECEADPITDCDGNGVLDSCEDLDCDGDGISNCGDCRRKLTVMPTASLTAVSLVAVNPRSWFGL